MTTIPVHVNAASRARFYWSHLYSSSYPGDSLRVEIKTDTSSTWETIWGKGGINLDSKDGAGNTSPGSFVEELVDLDTAKYLNNNVMIRFVGVSGYGPNLYMDTVVIEKIPPCPKPTNLTHYGIYTDSVDLTWLAGRKNSSWEIQIDTSGYTLGTGMLFASTKDSLSVGGLKPGTTYDFYLRSLCMASGDTSGWVGPYTFQTNCIADTIDYKMDFVAWPPKCWDMDGGVNDWISSGSSAAEADFWFVGSGDYHMKTVPVHINKVSRLKFYWSHLYNTSYPGDSLRVEAKVDTSTTWVTIWGKGGVDLDSKDGATSTSPGYYKKAVVNLDSATFMNKNVEVRFVAITGFGPHLYIDEVHIEKLPTCPEPDSLKFDSATTTSATFNWINGKNDVSWVLEYGPVGFTKGTGTNFFSSTNPGTITGLTHSTCYDVYLRGICSAGDTSDWIGPINFCTKCNSVSDFCEYFEGTASQDVPVCWNKFILTTATGNSSIGVSTFGAYSGSNHLLMSAGNDAASTLMLISPELSTLSSGTHRINFWVDGSFTPDTALVIGTMSDPTDPGTFTPWDTITDVTSNYENHRVNFDTYGGTDKHVAFLYNPTSTYRSISLDEICYEEIPSCEKAPAVTVLNDGQDSNFINLGWNIDTNQVNHIISYGPAGYDPVTNPAGGNTVTTTGGNFQMVTNLLSLTEYCFWVKAICKNGDTSKWVGPICAKTGCPSSTSVPYSEDFTSYTSSYPAGLPLCWQEGQGELGVTNSSIAISNSAWTSDGFANTSFTGAARMNLYFNGQSEWFISPRLDLGSDLTVSQTVEFDVALKAYGSSLPGVVGEFDSLAFLISKDGGITWNKSNIIEVWDTSNIPSSTGDHFSYTLNRGLGIVQFAFYCGADSATEDNDWFIDNFRISDTTYAGVIENSFAEAKFKVYPNPNAGVFNILNEGNSIQTSIKVMDIQGRVLLDESHYFNNSGRKRIDLSRFKGGVYVLVLQSGDKIEQHRIIVNK